MGGYIDTILADGPWGFWKQGEASGSPADSSGNGRTFTPNGTLAYGEASLLGTDGGDKSMKFGGGYLSLTNWWTDFASSQFTLETWLRRSDITTQSTLFGSNDAPHPTLLIPVSAGNSNGDIDWYSASNGSKVTWVNAVPDERVHYLAFTYDGTTRASELFIDSYSRGVLTAPQALQGSASFAHGIDTFSAGWRGWTQFTAVYAKILTPARIKAHNQAGSAIRRLFPRQLRVR